MSESFFFHKFISKWKWTITKRLKSKECYVIIFNFHSNDILFNNRNTNNIIICIYIIIIIKRIVSNSKVMLLLFFLQSYTN